MVGHDEIKFHIPDECRTFTIFQRLPPEIRQAIWEAYLSTPGVHFLKLQTHQGDWDWTGRRIPHPAAAGTTEEIEETDRIGDLVKEDKRPRQRHPTCLRPVSPSPKADVSQYIALRRQLAVLSRTCVESRNVAERMRGRPETLKLADGQLISLGKSSDLIYLDYFPPSLYQSDGNLETVPDCPDLKRIKRVAVRFEHTWRPTRQPCLCSSCNKGTLPSHKGIYPAHLYQMLARHFPNLEEFFFIDYFSVHRSSAQLDDGVTPIPGPNLRMQRFQAGNRTYHEVEEKDWIINKDVFLITAWLHQSFLRYAMHSPLCQHKNLEKVRFSVLACQWNITPVIQKTETEIKTEVRRKAAAVRFGGSTSRLRRARSGRHKVLLHDTIANSRQQPKVVIDTDDVCYDFSFPSMTTPVTETKPSQSQVAATPA